jgi:Tfp pilus assembly protein PilO
MANLEIGGQSIPAAYVGIALPVLAGLYVAYGAFMAEDALMARNDAITAKEASVEQKRQEAAELKTRTKEVDQIKAETEALEKSITLLKEKIPSDAQVPVLLYDLERMAKKAEIKLSSFAPSELRGFTGPGGKDGAAKDAGTGAATADIQELPVAIHAEATYPETIRFLEQLNGYERKLAVSNLSLQPGNSSQAGGSAAEAGKNTVFKNTLTIDFTLLAYVLKTGGAQP